MFNKIIIMYTQRCFSSKATKIVLTIFTIIIASMAIAHFLYARLYGTLLSFYGGSYVGSDKSLLEKSYTPPVAYFAISGIAQVAINLIYFLLLWEAIKLTKTTLGITFLLLILEFGMNFAIAVWSSMQWSYYQELVKLLEQYINSVDSKSRSIHSTYVSIFQLSAVESILTFVVILPAIILQILMILDRNTNCVYMEEKETAPEASMDRIEPRKQ